MHILIYALVVFYFIYADLIFNKKFMYWSKKYYITATSNESPLRMRIMLQCKKIIIIKQASKLKFSVKFSIFFSFRFGVKSERMSCNFKICSQEFPAGKMCIPNACLGKRLMAIINIWVLIYSHTYTLMMTVVKVDLRSSKLSSVLCNCRGRVWVWVDTLLVLYKQHALHFFTFHPMFQVCTHHFHLSFVDSSVWSYIYTHTLSKTHTHTHSLTIWERCTVCLGLWG